MPRIVYFYTYFWHRAKLFLVIHYMQNIPQNITKCNFIHMSEHWWGASEEVLDKITVRVQLCSRGDKYNVMMKDKDVREYT